MTGMWDLSSSKAGKDALGGCTLNVKHGESHASSWDTGCLGEMSWAFLRDLLVVWGLFQADDLDGEIDLRSCTDVTEYAVQRNYGFQIHVSICSHANLCWGPVGACELSQVSSCMETFRETLVCRKC